jgi:hypothetical protein
MYATAVTRNSCAGALLAAFLVGCSSNQGALPSSAASNAQQNSAQPSSAHARRPHLIPGITSTEVFVTTGSSSVVPANLYAFDPLFSSAPSSSYTISGDRLWINPYNKALFVHIPEWNSTNNGQLAELDVPWNSISQYLPSMKANADVAFGKNGAAFVVSGGAVFAYMPPYSSATSEMVAPAPGSAALHVATDAVGDLWVLDVNHLRKFAGWGVASTSANANFPSPTTTITLTYPSGMIPAGLAVDTLGNAFVSFSNLQGGTGFADEFDAQLNKIKQLNDLQSAPANDPSGYADGYNNPIAIDRNTNDLLVIGSKGICIYSPAQGYSTAIGTVPFGAYSVYSDTFSLDSAGNIWVPNQSPTRYGILEYSPPYSGQPKLSLSLPLPNGGNAVPPNGVVVLDSSL